MREDLIIANVLVVLEAVAIDLVMVLIDDMQWQLAERVMNAMIELVTKSRLSNEHIS